VLQCVAVCCSVLQCVAVCCSVLQCVAVRCNVLQRVAVCCSVLQRQHTAHLFWRENVCPSRVHYVNPCLLESDATRWCRQIIPENIYFSVLQCVAVLYRVMRCDAVCCTSVGI